ncbi:MULTISPECIES: cytochrome c oxidase assembly protein [Pseudonocardia]|jgi:putative copper resistance protein D|uniref:cytochrome c oxidase assembly protein n=1 Tax=Pseudonocardia TaxID=1847 RepID=UPI00307E0B17
MIHTVPAGLPPLDPPPLTVETMLFSWTFDSVVLVPLALTGVLYLWGVRRLRRRGDAWAPRRTAFFLLGLGLTVVGTASFLGVYDRVLFSVPAIQHMVLQMIAPVGLVLGAPISLALRALPAPGRRVVLAALHSHWSRLVSHPAAAFGIFAVTQFAFYYTPLYDLSLTNMWVHDVMHLHFVAVGFLFYWALLGIDPTPHRVRFSLKMILVVGMGPLHILLGVPIMMTSTLFAADYYEALGRDWGPSLLDDQHLGGAILWGFGDIAAIGLIGAFVRQWFASDERAARRTDRQLDRLYGDGPTIQPWWLSREEDTPDVLGPQRDGT